MLQKNALRGLDGPGEAPPLETSSCRIGFSILWGPVVVRMPRILRGVSEGPYGAWGGAAARDILL